MTNHVAIGTPSVVWVAGKDGVTIVERCNGPSLTLSRNVDSEKGGEFLSFGLRRMIPLP